MSSNELGWSIGRTSSIGSGNMCSNPGEGGKFLTLLQSKCTAGCTFVNEDYGIMGLSPWAIRTISWVVMWADLK